MSNRGIKKVVFSFAVSLVVFAIIFVAKAIITEKKVENGIYAIVTASISVPFFIMHHEADKRRRESFRELDQFLDLYCELNWKKCGGDYQKMIPVLNEAKLRLEEFSLGFHPDDVIESVEGKKQAYEAFLWVIRISNMSNSKQGIDEEWADVLNHSIDVIERYKEKKTLEEEISK